MDKQSEFLKNSYCSLGPKECASVLGISYRACTSRAARMGLNRRRARGEEIVEYIKKWYSKKTASECSCELGISVTRVRNIASELGVTGRRLKTRYSKRVNAEFFDCWTDKSAYILGFIYADGGLRRDRVSLYQNDKEYLEGLRSIMSVKNSIREHGDRCHVLSFNCSYMADRLREIGIRERKSFGNMVFPEDLPDSMYSHFFRGFFDGDGSVGVYGKWENLRISLFGENHFINRMYVDTGRLLEINSGGIRRASSPNRSFYTCSWGRREDVGKLSKWMYKGSNGIRLERKFDIIKKGLGLRPKWPIEIG